MKHLFIFFLLVFSLLTICNCKLEPNQNNFPTKTETKNEPTQEPEITDTEPPEVVPQGVEAGKGETPRRGDDEPPETVPPEEVPPETVPPEVVPPDVVTPEEEPEEDETTENENPIIELPDLALLQINEIRTEFTGLVNHAEYIEFKVLKSGSMEGLYLYSVMNNAQDIFVYIFPEIDVEAGEYITLHLRTLEKNNSCDELRDDLTISGGTDSCPSARDLWVTGNNKLIDKTCIVYIQDINGKIMDAVFLNEKPSTTWTSNQGKFAEIAERLCNEGMWKSAGTKPTPLDAFNTSTVGTSAFKSVSRYEGRENTHSAKDWYITGYITPGLPNK
jgi:hypothetical protein